MSAVSASPAVGRPRDDLASDFARCQSLRMPHVARFRSKGVSAFRLLGYRDCPFEMGGSAAYAAHRDMMRRRHGLSPVEFTPGFQIRRAAVHFEPRQRFIFGWDRRAAEPFLEPAFIIPGLDQEEALVDLIAWCPRTGRLASLNRRCGLLLAASWTDTEAPITVFPGPMPWLASGRRGVVVVHESLARPLLLEAPAIQAADIAHGVALKAMLTKVRIPSIVVPAETAARAAA